MAPFILPCGHCAMCVRGNEDLCDTFFALNRGKGALYDGTTRLYTPSQERINMYSMSGLAQYFVVPAHCAFPIPPAVPVADASILGCAIFTAYGAVKHAGEVQPGDSVAIIGAGGVGSNAIQMARAFGATQVRLPCKCSVRRDLQLVLMLLRNVQCRLGRGYTGHRHRRVDVQVSCLASIGCHTYDQCQRGKCH